MANRGVLRRRALTTALMSVIVLTLAAPLHAASPPDAVTPAGAPPASPPAVVEVPPPAPAVVAPGDQPAGETAPPPPPPVIVEAPPAEPETLVGAKIRQDKGYANAARQPQAAKRREARKACVENRPPISKMLGIGGIVAADAGRPWNRLVMIIAGLALVLAVAAFVRRRRSARGTALAPRGALETVSTLIAIFAGVVGLAVQFVPGIGVRERPAPEASMSVRDVQARITHGEFVKETRQPRLNPIDRRQVGNVVWLQISLQGYGGKKPILQYALYDPRAGGALLPHTEDAMALPTEDKDKQTSFVPVWVGYPKSSRFSAQFRLLEGRPAQVRQIASTGAMRGSKYRYACGYGRRAASVNG